MPGPFLRVPALSVLILSLVCALPPSAAIGQKAVPHKDAAGLLKRALGDNQADARAAFKELRARAVELGPALLDIFRDARRVPDRARLLAFHVLAEAEFQGASAAAIQAMDLAPVEKSYDLDHQLIAALGMLHEPGGWEYLVERIGGRNAANAQAALVTLDPQRGLDLVLAVLYEESADRDGDLYGSADLNPVARAAADWDEDGRVLSWAEDLVRDEPAGAGSHGLALAMLVALDDPRADELLAKAVGLLPDPEAWAAATLCAQRGLAAAVPVLEHEVLGSGDKWSQAMSLLETMGECSPRLAGGILDALKGGGWEAPRARRAVYFLARVTAQGGADTVSRLEALLDRLEEPDRAADLIRILSRLAPAGDEAVAAAVRRALERAETGDQAQDPARTTAADALRLAACGAWLRLGFREDAVEVLARVTPPRVYSEHSVRRAVLAWLLDGTQEDAFFSPAIFSNHPEVYHEYWDLIPGDNGLRLFRDALASREAHRLRDRHFELAANLPRDGAIAMLHGELDRTVPGGAGGILNALIALGDVDTVAAQLVELHGYYDSSYRGPVHRLRGLLRESLGDGLEPALRRMLASDSAPLVRFALLEVRDLGLDLPDGELARLIRHEDALVREAVLRLVGRGRFAKVSGGLHDLLLQVLGSDPDPRPRAATARACGRLALEASVPALLPLLEEPRFALRYAAHRALEAIYGGTTAYEPLAHAEDRADSAQAWRRVAAAEGEQVASLLVAQRPEPPADRYVQSMVADWIQEHAPALERGSAEERAAAYRELARLRSRGGPARLLIRKALSDPMPQVRSAALWCLPAIGADEACVSEAAQRLGDPDTEVALLASEVLPFLDRSGRAAAGYMDAEDPVTAVLAAVAVAGSSGRVPTERAPQRPAGESEDADLDRALAVLARGLVREDPRVQRRVAGTLQAHPRRAVPVLLARLTGGVDGPDREAILDVLAGMGRPGLQAVTESLDGLPDTLRLRLILRLAPDLVQRLGQDAGRFLEPLAASLGSEDLAVAASSRQSLARLLQDQPRAVMDALQAAAARGAPRGPILELLAYGVGLYRVRPEVGPAEAALAAEALASGDPAQVDPALRVVQALGPAAAPAVPAMLELMEDSEPDRARWIGIMVARCGPESLEALGDVLAGPDALAASAALSALQEVAAQQTPVTPALQRALASGRPLGCRDDDLCNLAARQGESGLPVLLALLERGDVPTCRNVLSELGRMGEAARPAADRVLGLLHAGDPELRASAVEVLSAVLGDDSRLLPALRRVIDDPAARVAGAAVSALRRLGPPAVPILLGLLDRDVPAVRETAVSALAGLGEPAREVIREYAGAKDPERRRTAMLAVGGFPRDVVLEVAGRGLDDPVAAVRAAAAGALTRSRSATPALHVRLAELVADSDPVTRAGAARALYYTGGVTAGVVSDAGALLADPEPWVRALALAVLARDAEPTAETRTAFLNALHDPSEVPRLAAIEGLRSAGTEVAPALAAMLGDTSANVRRRASFILMSMGASGTRAVVEALGSPDPAVRAEAARIIRWLEPPDLSALDGLLAILDDPDPDVRATVLEAVAKMARTEPRAAEAFFGRLEAKDPGSWFSACHEYAPPDSSVWGQAPRLPAACTPVLVRMLAHPDPALRQAAALTLGRDAVMDEEAVAAMRAACRDPDLDVRRAAASVYWMASSKLQERR